MWKISLFSCSFVDGVESGEQKPLFPAMLHEIFHIIPWQLKRKILYLVYHLLVSSRKSEFVKLENISEAKSGLTVDYETI